MVAPKGGCLDDVVDMHYLLGDLSQQWKTLGLPGRSLYRPSQAEHEEKLGVIFEERAATQRLREDLGELLFCAHDGWVSAERWEEVLPIYQEQCERFKRASLLTSGEDGESEIEAIRGAQRLWPFDLR